MFASRAKPWDARMFASSEWSYYVIWLQSTARPHSRIRELLCFIKNGPTDRKYSNMQNILIMNKCIEML